MPASMLLAIGPRRQGIKRQPLKARLAGQMATAVVLIYFCVQMVSILRQPTQDTWQTPEEHRRAFRKELEDRERAAALEKAKERGPRGWCFCQYYTCF